MRTPNEREQLDKVRAEIAKQVRELRKGHRWTQAELAARIGLSQARLSEVEGGDGSFTAEQFLLILKLFNVGVSRFSTTTRASADRDRESALQNALVRLGAAHLQESPDVLPSERLDEARTAVRETLVLAESPRLITALAPVLVGNVERINVNKLQLELSEAGFPRRLPWLADNVIEALGLAQFDPGSRTWIRACRRTYVLLKTFVDAVRADLQHGDADGRSVRGVDVLDSNIRSEKTRGEVAALSSAISKRWGVVTSLQPEDFVHALESAHAVAVRP